MTQDDWEIMPNLEYREMFKNSSLIVNQIKVNSYRNDNNVLLTHVTLFWLEEDVGILKESAQNILNMTKSSKSSYWMENLRD